jgi:hypothetical protein
MYLSGDFEDEFTISVEADSQGAVDHVVPIHKTGPQRVRVPIDIRVMGRHFTITFTSTVFFRLDQIEVQLILRSSGIIGY